MMRTAAQLSRLFGFCCGPPEVTLVPLGIPGPLGMTVIDRHQDSAGAISKALVQFRKNSVDSSRREWGAIYKQIKTDLPSLYNAQRSRSNTIVVNSHNLGRNVKSLQASSLQNALLDLDAADDFFKDMKAKTPPATANHRIIGHCA
jgi:hypothetical protein